ncbi:MAG: succinate dehydrogenase [Bacteroidia bacterium]|nr:succinate dehydrogenase [Bacteroidia bacterium]MCF8426038.1 succinate dehydrogenase [Bacteroidia bacterium]MCF8445367.1 succinate dehydrogenase [Bacteroidia bacterium]
MNWVTKMFSSSIGQKFIMALTGLFLCSFLVIHMVGNLQLFKADDGLAFNTYAVFMTTFPVIKFVSYVLYASIIFHAIKGLMLVSKNNKARPVKYAVQNGAANSHWTSRSMGILGTLVLVFIVIHMKNFWFEYKFGHEVGYTSYFTNIATGETGSRAMEAEYKQHNKIEETMVSSPDGQQYKIVVVKDLYKEVATEFKEWWLVALYVLCMFAVAFHLYHGFQSAFQTLGINHSKYNGLIKFIGIWVFSVLIPAGFAAMPIFFFFK